MKNRVLGNTKVKYDLDGYLHCLREAGFLNTDKSLFIESSRDLYSMEITLDDNGEIQVLISGEIYPRNEFEDKFINTFEIVDSIEEILDEQNSDYYFSTRTRNTTDHDLEVVLGHSTKPNLDVVILKRFDEDMFKVFQDFETGVSQITTYTNTEELIEHLKTIL